MDCKGVILSGGGEPLLHPRFIQALKLLKERRLKIGVNTNRLALDRAKVETISECCEYCRISLDCGEAGLYRKTHGMDEKALSVVLDNIRNLAAINRKTGSHLSLGTGFLTGKETVRQMESFVKLSKECGADFAQFRPFQEDMTDISV